MCWETVKERREGDGGSGVLFNLLLLKELGGCSELQLLFFNLILLVLFYQQALVRLGATVTGIDAASSMVEAAKQHASLDPSLHDRLRYLNTTSSDLVLTEAERFDGVVASEVVEHVSDLEGFLGDCVRLTKVEHLCGGRSKMVVQVTIKSRF